MWTFKSKQIWSLFFLEVNLTEGRQKSRAETVSVSLRRCLLNCPGDLQTTHLVGPPTLTIYWRVWLFESLSCGNMSFLNNNNTKTSKSSFITSEAQRLEACNRATVFLDVNLLTAGFNYKYTRHLWCIVSAHWTLFFQMIEHNDNWSVGNKIETIYRQSSYTYALTLVKFGTNTCKFSHLIQRCSTYKMLNTE